MVEISINGKAVEAEPGRRLVEVIKEEGITITNLCYIDGLEPYAGCRTCIIDIEGGRPSSLQLSCTAQVTEGQVIQTDTPEVKQARQSVMSVILANHPDRCLTCHRRVHCMPGDICLRDDVVTHRCLTCSKNYRCELQTSCENVDQGDFAEPWVGEKRSYYETPPPEPDRGNPFLEFDPQMCIICTRCVRACDELRHTGALTLSGKGHSTMIAFGTGTQIHESDCDFCGACIDVCPTATLMEKPNKWNGRADDWTSAVCNSCSVGCTLTYGTSDQVGSENGPVIVRPERINPFSRDQICVRGRFGYDAIDSSKRLEKSMVRTEGNLLPVGDSEAIAVAASQIQNALNQSGPDSIAMLGSPLTTTEEAMYFSNIADALEVKNLDFSLGVTHRAVLTAFDDAFGTAVIPTELTDIEESKTIICIGTDLEESHQAVSLRIKGMVRKSGSDLVLISPKWSELDNFAKAVIRCLPGEEAYVADQLAKRFGVAPGAIDQATWDKAVALISDARDETRSIVVFAPNAVDQEYAGELAASASNLAISLAPERAHECVMYLPPDGNTNGIHDAGVSPRDGGHSFSEMIPAMLDGGIKCLVVHDDNPLINGLGTDDIDLALRNLDSLIVIDSVQSSLLEYSTVAISEAAFYHRSGSITTADRRVLVSNSIDSTVDSQKSGLAILRQIAERLGINVDDSPSFESLSNYPSRTEVATSRGTARAVGTGGTYKATPVEVRVPTRSSAEGLRLFTSRSLYTSWEGTSTSSEEADKLDRDGVAWINPLDAVRAGIKIGDSVAIRNNGHELSAPVRLDDGVNPGTVYVPSYFKSAAVMSFFRYGPSQDAPVIEMSAE